MKNILIIISFIFFQIVAFAQADKTLQLCDDNISHPFVSDGQEYRALLDAGELAEFNVIFYGGSTYRVSACSGNTEGNLTFSVYDQERNLLFSNRDNMNSPYWDFKINNTVKLIIEAEIKENVESSGFAFIQIGFKQ